MSGPGRQELQGCEGPASPPSLWFQGSDGSFSSHVSFRKRKGDEVDGMDEVAKKKSKKEKDKDSKLERALKVSSELWVSAHRSLNSLPSFWEESSGGRVHPTYRDLQEFPNWEQW